MIERVSARSTFRESHDQPQPFGRWGDPRLTLRVRPTILRNVS